MKTWKRPCNFFVQERRLEQPSEGLLETTEKQGESDDNTKIKEILSRAEAEVATSEEAAVFTEDEKAPSLQGSSTPEGGKKIFSVHAIKCKCGDILSRKMKQCPSCGKSVELLLEELRQDFYRINFMQSKKDNK